MVVGLFILGLLLPCTVYAGEKGQLVSLLADYADLRERVREVREARKSGYASDSKMLIKLSTEILDASSSTSKFRSSTFKVGEENKNAVVTSYMIFAYSAMHQIVQSEVARNLFLLNLDFPLRLADKYDEIWKFIDSSIPSLPAVPGP